MKQIKILYQKQEGKGPTLGYTEESGLRILEKDGCYFKDYAGNGELEPYADWRLSAAERADDLAGKLSVEELAGLMVYSCMVEIPNASAGALHARVHTYGGKPFEESGMDAAAISDQVRDMVEENHMRHFTISGCRSVPDMVEWNNRLQSLAEAQPHGIPCVKASDPRHGIDAVSRVVFHPNENLSVWSERLGMAAVNDPKQAYEFGQVLAKEYRALGIHCSLGPQVDTASDPRWIRYKDTFGSDTERITQMGKAMIDGCQTSTGDAEVEDGWGYDSVYSIVKHWPGGGTGEGGRDAHFALGKYAVYPGGDFERHMKPFLDGAFQLDGPTKQAGGVMPYYTISTDVDTVYHENVGNSFSRYIVHDLLREKYRYDGIVCTDWEIITDAPETVDAFAGKCWGVENLTTAERAYKALACGVDQFGGLDTAEAVLDAYRLGAAEHGEAWMIGRMRQSAERLLTMIFRLGLFENPYLDVERSLQTVGCADFTERGRAQQARSAVLLKNKKQTLPLKRRTSIYMSKIFHPFLKQMVYPVDEKLLNQYFEVTDDPEVAEAAVVLMHSPIHKNSFGMGRLQAGYDVKDRETGGNGYVPISLQYRPYQAVNAREVSLAGGDPAETGTNRSYRGKTAYNMEEELDRLEDTVRRMKGKPVIAGLEIERPCVVGEFEPSVDAILVHFGMEDEVLLKLLSGVLAPGGSLPFRLPKDMDSVELHSEDADDIVPYVDAEQHIYTVGYGLNRKVRPVN